MRKIIFIILAITISVFNVFVRLRRKKMPPKARVNLRNANLYRQQLKLDKAMSFYQDVLKENPENLEATKYVAEIYFKYEGWYGSQQDRPDAQTRRWCSHRTQPCSLCGY